MSNQLHNVNSNICFTEVFKFYFPIKVPIKGGMEDRKNTIPLAKDTESPHSAAQHDWKRVVLFHLLGVSASQNLFVLCPCCLQNRTLHSVGAAQLLPLCPNGLLMTTTFCSTQRGHGGRGPGVFVCVFDFSFEMVDGYRKETEDIQLIKTKIVMRERDRGRGMRWSRWLWRGVKYDEGRVSGEEEERDGESWGGEVKRDMRGE